jgi:DNA-binding NarL/FixJ family response regulator
VNPSSGSNGRFRVLIADDVDDLRSLYRYVLELSGLFTIVAEAGNGRHAIEMASEHQPDLVILDLAMPEMDGAQALPEIIEASPGSKIVVLSGFAERSLGQMVRTAGAAAFLEKGITPDRLVAELGRVMRAD